MAVGVMRMRAPTPALTRSLLNLLCCTHTHPVLWMATVFLQCMRWLQQKRPFNIPEPKKPETEMVWGFFNYFSLIWWVVQTDAGAQSKPLDSKTLVYHSPCYPFPGSSMWSSSHSLGLLLLLQVVVVSNPLDPLIYLSCDQSRQHNLQPCVPLCTYMPFSTSA